MVVAAAGSLSLARSFTEKLYSSLSISFFRRASYPWALFSCCPITAIVLPSLSLCVFNANCRYYRERAPLTRFLFSPCYRLYRQKFDAFFAGYDALGSSGSNLPRKGYDVTICSACFNLERSMKRSRWLPLFSFNIQGE